MKKRKILLVDDEVSILELYKEAFEQRGYEVDTAETAEDALSILKNEEYPVMFFDIVLPGMNGIDLLKEVIKIYPDSFIYAVTGYPTQFEREGCLAVGFTDYFAKPVALELLLKAAEDGFREWKKIGGKGHKTEVRDQKSEIRSQGLKMKE